MIRQPSTSLRRAWSATAWLACCALAALAGPAMAADDTAAVAAQIDTSDPGKLIQTTASAMLKDLDAHRADYKKDPNKVHHLVDEILLPHFDTEYSARLVLGKYWNTASADQRTRFVNAFYKSMLSNYGDALVDFTSDRLKVFPYTGDAKAQYATVRTQIRKDDGSQVAVNYSLRQTDQGWKAWDVIIEGISYVKSFRDDFSSEIDQKGLDEVIARLESGVKPTAIAGAASGKKS
jgi:phospholipid transport system substrate-binding protein